MRLVLLCFALSGAVGLTLEIVWIRLLSQVFGSTTLAISTVLATFMGGLALGSWLGGKVADRLRWDPLMAYAACEAGIAVSAFAIPFVVRGYPQVNAWLWGQLGESPMMLALVRFGLCAVLLLPPTILMGATLPILSRRVIRTGAEFSRVSSRVGALYAANTAGAVVGVVAAAFWLLPGLGLQRLNLFGVAAALAVACVAVVLGRLQPARELDAEEPSEQDPKLDEGSPSKRSSFDARLAMIAFAVSGGVMMALEVLLSRALAIVMGSATESMAIVLAMFLLGIAVGAAVVGRPAARIRDPIGWLSFVFIGITGSVMVVHYLMDALPEYYASAATEASGDVRAMLAAVVLPIALFSGAVMPLAVRAYVDSVRGVGQEIGRLYAANTVGSIVGSFAGGFVVLPTIGLERGVAACAYLFLLMAGLLAFRSASRWLRWPAWTATLGMLLGLVVLPAWDLKAFTAGLFRHVGTTRHRRDVLSDNELLYYRDGLVATITVRKAVNEITLYSNGKPEASSIRDRGSQILVGLIPVYLHGGSDLRVLVIGYGSGMTVGAVAQASSVESVDVIELEPAMYEAGDQFFGEFTHSPGSNPKVRCYVGDGRNFLAARATEYDVIISEPSNPWVGGTATLFTEEYYQLVDQHLSESGVFCQWAQVYELRLSTLKMIYRTLLGSFPNAIVFSNGGDSILIGSRQPLRVPMSGEFEDIRVDLELERGGISSPYDLLARLILGPGEIASFVGEGPVNTDDSMRLEFAAQHDFLDAVVRAESGAFRSEIRRGLGRFGRYKSLFGDVEALIAAGFEPAKMARALIDERKFREAKRWITRLRATDPDGAAALSKRLVRSRGKPRSPSVAGGRE